MDLSAENQREISNLLSSLTLRALRQIHEESIAGKLDDIVDLARSLHDQAMAKLDAETNELAAQLEELAAGGNAEQAARLRGLAGRLNAMGKV